MKVVKADTVMKFSKLALRIHSIISAMTHLFIDMLCSMRKRVDTIKAAEEGYSKF